MRRRKFLAGAAAASAAAAAASGFPAPAISQEVRQLRLVSAFVKDFPGLGTSAARVAKRITEATDGRLRVKLFNAGELASAKDLFDVVSQGDADFYYSADHYYQNKSRAFNFFTAVPFGLTGPETYAWIHYGGGQELWDELAAQFNLKPFISSTTGVQMGGWCNKRIKTVDDLKGLKFRMPGLGGEVLRRLGASLVTIHSSEIFEAMKSGALDGTAWVGPWHDLAFGLHKVAKYYYFPGFHQPGATTSHAFNLKVWQSLPADQKLVVELTLEAEAHIQSAEYDAANALALDTLVEEHKVRLRHYPAALIEEFGRVSGEVVEEIGNTDEVTRRIWLSYLEFRRKAIGWSKVGLQAYLNARTLPFKFG